MKDQSMQSAVTAHVVTCNLADANLSACRCQAVEARQQTEASAHLHREQQLRSAVDRLQVLAQHSRSQAMPQPSPSDGRLQAAQARTDRAEGRLIAQQGKTQQVTLAGMHFGHTLSTQASPGLASTI